MTEDVIKYLIIYKDDAQILDISIDLVIIYMPNHYDSMSGYHILACLGLPVMYVDAFCTPSYV